MNLNLRIQKIEQRMSKGTISKKDQNFFSEVDLISNPDRDTIMKYLLKTIKYISLEELVDKSWYPEKQEESGE